MNTDVYFSEILQHNEYYFLVAYVKKHPGFVWNQLYLITLREL